MLDATRDHKATSGPYKKPILTAFSLMAMLMMLTSCPPKKLNHAAFFGWRGYADTNLKFSQFFTKDHTIIARFMLHYPYAYSGPIVAENGSGTYVIGQGDFYAGAAEGARLLLQVGSQTRTYPSSALTAGKWLHVAVVRSGNIFTLYLNGAPQSPAITSNPQDSDLPSPNSTLRFGRRTNSQPLNNLEAQFYGLADDIAVFDKALSAQQISNIINETDQRLSGNEANLLAGWTFDDYTPSGGTLPKTLTKYSVTFGSLTSGQKTAGDTVVSQARQNNLDWDILEHVGPYQQVDWQIPFKAGQAWNITQGFARFDSPDSSHNGSSAFSLDMMLAGTPTPGKPANPNGAACGEPVYTVAAGTVLSLKDDCSSDPLCVTGSTAWVDGKNFMRQELAKDEIAVYMHTLTGSVAEALGNINPPAPIGKDVLIAKVGTRLANNCHLHLASSSGLAPKDGNAFTNPTDAVLSQKIQPPTAPVTFPYALSNYEACDAQNGNDCTKEQNWYQVKRGVPKQGQWIRRPAK